MRRGKVGSSKVHVYILCGFEVPFRDMSGAFSTATKTEALFLSTSVVDAILNLLL